MTKDVIISLVSEQYTPDGIKTDEINNVIRGLYSEKNGTRYILYDEDMEGLKEAVRTKVKFNEKYVEIVRSKPVNNRMVFEENKINMTSYKTPYGNIALGINTREIAVTDEEMLTLRLVYSLETEGGTVSENKITIVIKSAV